MDQSRALNALAPFLALAKSATSPRAAADLITQATSAPHTYVFAELLQQANVQALAGHQQFGGFFELLKLFAWGTWEEYQATPNLPPLSESQASKLRLLSLLTIAARPPQQPSRLSYGALLAALQLDSAAALETLVTGAIYQGLVQATLNPAAQTVVVSAVAPLRDLAPGSVAAMVAELGAWSVRCDGVLRHLEAEMARVRAQAAKRNALARKVERQVKAVTEGGERGAGGGGLGVGLGSGGRGGHNSRGIPRGRLHEVGTGDGEEDDAMEVDGSGMNLGGAGKKRSSGGGGGGIGGIFGKMGVGRNSGR